MLALEQALSVCGEGIGKVKAPVWSGRVKADVAVASSGEAGEVEVTRLGGTQEGQSDFRL